MKRVIVLALLLLFLLFVVWLCVQELVRPE